MACARPKTSVMIGLTEIESSVKAIIFQALSLLIDNIRQLMQNHIDHAIKHLIDHDDQTISCHAKARRTALKKWLKVTSPLAWGYDGLPAGNYVLLSLMLCEDPNDDDPALKLTPNTYESLVQHLVSFTTKSIGVRHPAPLTKQGAFQFALPIAYNMICQLVPAGNNKLEYWNHYLIMMMKSMKIHLIPWHKPRQNAYATDPKVWTSLRQNQILSGSKPLTLEDRVQKAAESRICSDPHAPWDIPDRLSDMKTLWTKEVLPICWDISHSSLPPRRTENQYMLNTYDYVFTNYDGKNWVHHLALIIAICFSCVAPDVCLDNKATIDSRDGPGTTAEIRQMEWLPVQSASHKGTVAPLPFIVMMSTALIGFWDSKSPLSKHLISNSYILGKPWTDKHGNYPHISSIIILLTDFSKVPSRFTPSISSEWVWLLLQRLVSSKMQNSVQTGFSNPTVN